MAPVSPNAQRDEALVLQETRKQRSDAKRKAYREAQGWSDLTKQTTGDLTRRSIRASTQRIYRDYLHVWQSFGQEYKDKGNLDPRDVKTAKDFLIYHVKGSKGRLDPTRVAQSSVKTFWKSFCTAWMRETGEEFPMRVRETILNYIEDRNNTDLNLTTAIRSRANFTYQDLQNTSRQLWQNDWHDFLHERYRVQLHFAVLLHCFTTARVGEYYESTAKRGSGKGLTYRDTEVWVWWRDNEPQIVINVDRNNVKGYEDLPREQPLHLLYELSDHELFLNATAFFLALALADGVFKKYQTWDEIVQIPRPDGYTHVILHYKDEVLDMPILRRCKPSGPLNQVQSAATFAEQLVQLGHRTGIAARITAHSFRREGLLKVDERMRHAAHRDEKTYARSYQSKVSVVDGQASFLGMPKQREHQELFRGYSFRLGPHQSPWIPKEVVSELERNPTWRMLQESLQDSDISNNRDRRQKIYDQLRRLRDDSKKQYWIQRSTDSQEATQYLFESPFQQTRKLMPSRNSLAELLFMNGNLREPQGRQAMQDLIDLCRQKRYDTTCPNLTESYTQCIHCGKHSPHLRTVNWLLHLYVCRETYFRRQGQFARFCWICFQWTMDRDVWTDHCQSHLRQLPYRCDLQIFRKTIAHPGLCPVCLGKESWASEKRMTQFCQYSAWLRHVQSHLPGPLSTGGRCCHPRCHDSTPLASNSEIRDHWIDVHRIPSDVFSTQTGPKPGKKRSRSTIESSDESSEDLGPTASDVDSFVSYTAESFKLKPKGRYTGLARHGTDAMHDQHSPSQEDDSSSLKSDLDSDQPSISAANDDEILSPSAKNSLTSGEILEQVSRRSSLTAHSNESIVGVDEDTDSDAEWEVQAITDSKMDPCRGFLYRIVWVGDWDDSWEPPTMLSCPDLVDDFHKCNPKKPSLTMGDRLEKE